MIERAIELSNYALPGKVLALFGPRRSGKTTILKKYISNLSDKNVLLLNADRYDIRKLLSPQNFEDFEIKLSDIDVLAIDEAQNVSEIGLTLKLITDEYPNITVIATGSSSFDLRKQIGEPLVGRKIAKVLYPFSVSELRNWRSPAEILNISLVYGQYPDVIMAESNLDRENYLYELVDSLLLKDILAYKEIKAAEIIFDLLKLLAYQIGNEVSINELSNKLGIHKDTIKRYLDLLEKSFIITKLNGFSGNLRNEVTKKPKYYFYDIGIRNAIIRDFTPINLREDKGGIFENWCVMEKIKYNNYKEVNSQLNFWRNYQGNEIDLLETKNSVISGFEFKYSQEKANLPISFSKNIKLEEYKVINHKNVVDWLTSDKD